MPRFWVYIGDKIQGPLDIPSLRKVTGFNLLSQVCQEGEQSWRVADEVIEIKAYFLSPPRPNSLAINAGNTAPQLDLSPMVASEFEEMTLPEPNISWGAPGGASKGTPDLEVLFPDDSGRKETAGPGAALRAVCDVCGYKNPRDVAICMKCGDTLKGTGSKSMETPPPVKSMPSLPTPTPAPSVVSASSPVVEPVVVDSVSNSMVEISMGKLMVGTAVALIVAGGSFFGFRSWKKHQKVKKVMAPVMTAPKSESAIVKKASKYVRAPKRAASSLSQEAAALPGISPTPQRPRVAQTVAVLPKTDGASYRVVAEATPRLKRFSSPVNSPYAVKRRSNQGLWSAQEEHAIQQVQHYRIYGGLRTLERNVEILMQILRDREYNTAFENGKRIYLYNDMDWSAALKEGPVYEVRLTFSGGREIDGSPKKPLHFAFLADLERGTVEAGGEDQIRSNTMHAYFDESRIPPEERRAIAKDTEELVLAAQPGASPLALDTVVRQFAKVYTTAALSRVADAYDLSDVKRKLAHDTRLGSETATENTFGGTMPAKPVKGVRPTSAVAAPENREAHTPLAKPAKPETSFFTAKGGGADFRMERGSGREKTFLVRTTSKASVSRIWEVLTGYDRLKQFMPDMLASEREGQDGAATIVHTICLTRYMVFMFKINLHLRVIEHPREHTIDFERIAGEFESFRGAVEVTTDPATRESQISFHATVVPNGHSASFVTESMAKRLLVPQLESIRAKAEAN